LAALPGALAALPGALAALPALPGMGVALGALAGTLTGA
jgi:hypothetical protein